ncbi:hypothetical protein [Halococcus sediminicola]|uniref:hypothetical protein n=1 Tax=Halococcus sediminicola TaxID=1264579 RepID=UPI000679E6BA|nr:hypothetical protein [Halococcus sediminicola]
MDRPSNLQRPFFTYGIFKPGQIAHFRLEDFIDDTKTASVDHPLYERDGIPLLNTEKDGRTNGVLLWFNPEDAERAYMKITQIEPGNQYRCTQTTATADDTEYNANILVGINPKNGGHKLEDHSGSPIQDWDGEKNDPFFNEALDVVEEKIKQHTRAEDNDFSSYFELQMAYLLLWTVIERYVTLRYGFGANSYHERKRMAIEEDGFREGLEDVLEHRDGAIIRKTHKPEETKELSTIDPEQAIHYYYQVRNNIAHRGKSLDQDIHILRSSLLELYTIFNDYVLPDAFDEDSNP